MVAKRDSRGKKKRSIVTTIETSTDVIRIDILLLRSIDDINCRSIKIVGENNFQKCIDDET